MRLTAPFRFLANISYSLYVIHPIAGYVTMRLLTAEGLPYLAAFAIALAFVIGIASSMHVYVEAPTIALGKRSPKLDLARASGGRRLPPQRPLCRANSARPELSQPFARVANIGTACRQR